MINSYLMISSHNLPITISFSLIVRGEYKEMNDQISSLTSNLSNLQNNYSDIKNKLGER